MQKLTVERAIFLEMLPGLVKSGVAFEASPSQNDFFITITFTGGY